MRDLIPAKTVLTCALTGALANRKQCPAIPYTPQEIAEEARRAYEAGAAIVHIHAREDDGAPTFDPAVFARIKAEVRERCPVLINFSTGSLDEDTTLQERMIRECRPDFAALNMGTMNYAKYSSSRKQFVFDHVFPNSFGKIQRLLGAMNEAGVKPELECFDIGHTRATEPFIDMGELRPPFQFSFIVNVLGGLPATVDAIQLQLKTIPQNAQWEIIGISDCQWRMVATALILGGNIRVGLEDHLYLPDGSMAASNGALVAQAAALARMLGREPASVAETRSILGLRGDP